MGNIFIWIYFAIMTITFVVIGIASGRKNKNEDDYATARESYSWWVIGLTIPATFASGATFLGSAGMVYGYGFPAFWYLLGYPIGGYLGMTFLGRLGTGINKSGARTIPEFIGLRYNSDALRVITAVISFMLLAYIGGQIVAGGTIFQTLFGVDYKIGAIVSTLVVLSYIVVGGARANIVTATIQACVMLIVALCAVAIFFAAPGLEGGISELNAKLLAIDPVLGAGSVFNEANKQLASGFAVALTFFAHMPYSLLPHFGMKWASLKSPKEMPKALILAGVVGIIFVIGAACPALITRATIPDLPRADMALVVLFDTYLPDWISAFMVIGIFCAIMSTASGLFISNAQAIANDIYRGSIAKKLKHSEETAEVYVKYISRIATVIIAVLATLLVLNPPPYLTLFLWIGVGGVLSSTSGPVLLGLYWKGTTKTAAYITCIGCFAVYLFLVSVQKWEGMTATGLMFVVSLVVMGVLSLITKDRMPDSYLAQLGIFKDLKKGGAQSAGAKNA
jgi:sodium/proline symporter